MDRLQCSWTANDYFRFAANGHGFISNGRPFTAIPERKYGTTDFGEHPMKEPTQNELPDIRIDRDGVWYYRNMEMTRKEIVQYFYQHLQRDHLGHYRIELNNEQCRVQVDDVPYVIRGVSLGLSREDAQTTMIVTLSDGSFEELDPETLRIGDKNVLYCRVKKREYEARFSRQAYYQMAENLNHDPHQDRYFIMIGNRSYTVAVKQSTENGGAHVG
jgi:uncharacterized protein